MSCPTLSSYKFWAEDAVRSCVLSKRWRCLWTSIHNLLLSNRNHNNIQKFISFVDQVLTHSTCSNIKKFQQEFHGSYRGLESKISQWLSSAVEKKAEDVGLHTYPYENHLSYKLPPSMYTFSSLITLALTSWRFEKGLAITWNSLKSLTLRRTSLRDDDFVKLLSSCPALETMELSYCANRRLQITYSNLKRLTLSNYLKPVIPEYGASLEIFAPHLKHLDISGGLGELQCRLVNLSSLVTANLTFNMRCITDAEGDNCSDYHQDIRNLILDYLQKLSSLTELTIGSWFAQVVLLMKLEGMVLPELICKCLTLKLHVSEYNLNGIASLLQTSPFLESLNIHIKDETFSNCQFVQSYFDEADNINLLSWIPNTMLAHLKNVKTVGCQRECLKEWFEVGTCKLFKLSEFLLKNALALQKLVIMAKRRKCCICSESCVSRHLSQLAKKLLDTSRSSTNFAITYQEIA